MDIRAQQAREHHEAVGRADHEAEMHREQRDRLVRQLRAEDPVYWSYGRLVRTVGCSKSRIKQILEQEEATT